MMIRTAILAGIMAIGTVSAAFAVDVSVMTRQELMKAAKAAAGVSGAMVKGEMPYDAVKAELAMRTLYSVAAGFPHYFPESTKGDLDSEALDKVWDDAEGFATANAKFEADALAAIKPSRNGLDSFRPVFGKVVENCKGCHDGYREKK